MLETRKTKLVSIDFMVKSDQTKEKILIVARDKFFQHGFRRVSVDEIAGELGISKKTFYQFYEGKDELVAHIVERMKREVKTKMEGIVSQSDSFIDKLNKMMAFMGQTVSLVGTVFAQDLYKHKHEVWKGIQDFRRKRITDTFSRLLAEGVSQGYLKKEMNHRVFLMAYLGAVENIMQPNVLSQESFSARDALQAIVRIFFTGIMTETARKQFAKREIAITDLISFKE